MTERKCDRERERARESNVHENERHATLPTNLVIVTKRTLPSLAFQLPTRSVSCCLEHFRFVSLGLSEATRFVTCVMSLIQWRMWSLVGSSF